MSAEIIAACVNSRSASHCADVGIHDSSQKADMIVNHDIMIMRMHMTIARLTPEGCKNMTVC